MSRHPIESISSLDRGRVSPSLTLDDYEIPENFENSANYYLPPAPEKRADIFSRPELTPPKRVSSLYNLVSFVEQVEDLKKNLQEDNLKTIKQLSTQLNESRKECHAAQNEALRIENRTKYLNILKDIALFAGSAATLVLGNGWENAGLRERFFKIASLSLAATNIGVSTLERFDLIDNKHENLLFALNLLSFGTSFFQRSFGAANFDESLVTKIAELTVQLSTSANSIDQGISRYRSGKLDEKAFEHRQEMKTENLQIKHSMDNISFTEKRLFIEASVAAILKEYQDMVLNISNPKKG